MDQDNMTPSSDVDETTQNDAEATTPSVEVTEEVEEEVAKPTEETPSDTTE